MTGKGARKLSAGALVALVVLPCWPARAAGEDLAGSPRTEPVVSRAEAGLLREVQELARKDPAAAIRKLRDNRTGESSAALDFALAALLAENQRLAEAEGAYLAAVGKLPGFGRAWEHLGRVRLLRDRPREAAAALRSALKYRVDSAELWTLLGYSYLASERLLAADSAYRHALALAPDDREVLTGLAKTFLARERYGEALPLLRELSAREPLRGDFWMLEANAHLGMGDADRALVVLESAHRLGLLGAEALMTLGDLCYNKGLFDLAARRYDLAERGGEVAADRVLRCAEAFFHAGEIDTAAKFLSRAQAGGLEEPAGAHVLAGEIAAERGDLDAARKAFEAALEAAPLNGRALLALGELHWRQKEHEMADLVLERASRVRGFEVRALIQRAQIAVELDRYQQAVEHLEAAQELQPSPRVERYLDQIRRLAGLDGRG